MLYIAIAIYSHIWIWHYVNQETAAAQVLEQLLDSMKGNLQVFAGYMRELFYMSSEFHSP